MIQVEHGVRGDLFRFDNLFMSLNLVKDPGDFCVNMATWLLIM